MSRGLPGELLRDLGDAVARANATDDRPQEMMRLCGDPLLLRAFLARTDRRQETSRPGTPVPLPLAGPAHVRKSRHVPPPYSRREPLLEPSLLPEPFQASAEDCSKALVAEHSAERHEGRDGFHLVAAVALVLGLLSLILLLPG